MLNKGKLYRAKEPINLTRTNIISMKYGVVVSTMVIHTASEPTLAVPSGTRLFMPNSKYLSDGRVVPQGEYVLVVDFDTDTMNYKIIYQDWIGWLGRCDIHLLEEPDAVLL